MGDSHNGTATSPNGSRVTDLLTRVAQAIANTYARTPHPVAWETLAAAAIAEMTRETE